MIHYETWSMNVAKENDDKSGEHGAELEITVPILVECSIAFTV